jgi:hypothetical protein
MAGSGSGGDGFTAHFAAVQRFWEELPAILCLKVAPEKGFAGKTGNFLKTLKNAPGNAA